MANVVKGQCFDCYDDATFKYIGQTSEYNSKQVQLDYVAGLKKPSTTVECETCDRTMEYTEVKGYWKLTIK